MSQKCKEYLTSASKGKGRNDKGHQKMLEEDKLQL
jgi:hypothetical protein